nr:hypothetical protein [Tanacetum cinerariifolium]
MNQNQTKTRSEDPSKQERMIDNLDQDVDITLVDDTQGRMNEEDMFGVNDLDGDEVVMDVSAITTAIKVTTAATTEISKDELTLAQTLIEIKAAKPKAIIIAATIVTVVGIRSKGKWIIIGKGKMVVTERPLKRKDYIMMDAEVSKNLEAQMQDELEEEERLARLMKEETNIALIESWDNTQAMMDADYKLATRLQEEERGELSIEENIFEKAAEGSKKAAKGSEKAKEDDDDVTIKATPLSSKSPTIVDYKIYNEGKKSYFKIIKADVRFKKTKPVDDIDNLLFQTLKTMFEHHAEDNIRKLLPSSTKVNAASSRVTTVDKVTTVEWINTGLLGVSKEKGSISLLAKRLTKDTYDDLFDYLQQFEKLVNASRAKKLEKSHDPLAFVAHTGSSSRTTSPYYVTHPSLVVEYEDDYQGDAVQNNSEDPLTSAMILLARAITQRFSNSIDNRLRTSSNTRNYAIVQGDRVNIQNKNPGNDGRNTRCSFVQEGIIEVPSYDSAFLSKVQTPSTSYVNPLFAKDNKEQKYPKQPQTINNTIGDDQIDSNIIFDNLNEDVNSGSVENDNNVQESY